jgi:hypothetical protein
MLENMPHDPSTPAPADHEAEGDRILTSAERERLFLRKKREDQKGNGTRLREVLLKMRDDYRRLDWDARVKHMQDIDIMFRYFDGDQYGDYDTAGVYQQFTRTAGDFAYTLPVFIGHVETAFGHILKIRPQFEFHANEGDNPARRSVAKMCEVLAQQEYERLMDEDKRQEEVLNTILAGESWRELLWTPDKKRPKVVTRPEYEAVEEFSPARRECAACHSDAPPVFIDGAEMCDECGATEFVDVPEQVTIKQVPAGESEHVLGANAIAIPHPVSVQRDLSAKSLDESPFIVVRDTLPLVNAEWDYKADLNTGNRGLSMEAQIIEEQARATMQTDSVVGSARPAQWSWGRGQLVERARHYCDVSEYGSIWLDHAETLPNGDKTPAGKFMGEIWPEGLFFNVVGDTIVEIEPVRKWRKWLVVRYGRRPGSGRGSGMMAAKPIQDLMNDFINLANSIEMTSGYPLTVVNRRLVPQLPDPNNYLYMDSPDEKAEASHAVYRVPGESGSRGLPTIMERVAADMQFILGTHSIMGQVGAPDQATMGTATGVAAAVESSSQRFIGPTEQRVFADKEFRIQILENIQEHTADVPEQREELERRFGPDTVELFYETNFRTDITISVAKGSDRPRSLALTAAATAAIAQMSAALSQVPWGQELISTLMEEMGVPLEIGEGRTDRTVAEYRLNKLAAIMHVAAREGADLDGPGAEESAAKAYMLLAQQCGPLVTSEGPQDLAHTFMQHHPAFMDAYKDALQSDEAKMWPMAHKRVVIKLWGDHFNAMAMAEMQKAMVAANVQQMVAPPAPPPEPGTSPDEVKAASEEERARGLEDEEMRMEAEEAAKDADLERQMLLKEHEATIQAELAAQQPPEKKGANA